MVETQLRSEGSAGTTGVQHLIPSSSSVNSHYNIGNELSAHLSNPLFVSLTAAQNLLKRSHRSDAGENSRNEVKAPLLLKKCEVLQGKLSDETKKTRREVESISRTLSVGLLEHIRTSFLNASEDNQQAGQVCSIHYDKLNVRSTVQEIVELQTTLDATQNEDEQRALEEDITGKILWFCWCGVSAEVDQLLPKVLIYVRTKFDSMAPKPTPDYDARRGFRAIAEIMQKTPRTGQEDDMTHLQRIMLDAGAGVSKHKLWLGARAAEQARCGRLLKGDPAVDNQETGLSTSPEAPSTSIVHQELDTGAKRL
ncbi:hypothetical protein EDD16DRAFT_1240456 [Pisolithus croceorrhizus]|nr:hypothetical protein EDD16DRAFT_1240456 [Pisolithus croceorrhizus]